VLKLLRHLVCLGLLLGLTGNGVAVAAPCAFMTQNHSAVMADMPDCPMGSTCPDCGAPASDHGKSGKAPGCMMMTGCITALAMREPIAPLADQNRTTAAVFWPSAPILAGRDTAPEPEPPAFLG